MEETGESCVNGLLTEVWRDGTPVRSVIPRTQRSSPVDRDLLTV